MKKFIFILCLFFMIGLQCSAQTITPKKEIDAKIVTAPSDVQQTFQLAQSEIERAEAEVKAAQAALEAAKAKRDALILRIQLFLKLPFDAKPQLSKEGLLEFLLPDKEPTKPPSETKPK